MMAKDGIRMKPVFKERIHHNAAWKEFLIGLPSDYDRDVACVAMTWIKEFLQDKYPEAVSFLNGKLIEENILED